MDKIIKYFDILTYRFDPNNVSNSSTTILFNNIQYKEKIFIDDKVLDLYYHKRDDTYHTNVYGTSDNNEEYDQILIL